MKKLLLTVSLLLSAGMNAGIVDLGNGLVADVIENSGQTIVKQVTYFGKTIATHLTFQGTNISPEFMVDSIQTAFGKEIAEHAAAITQAANEAAASTAAAAVEGAAEVATEATNETVKAVSPSFMKRIGNFTGSVWNTCTQPVKNFYSHPKQSLNETWSSVKSGASSAHSYVAESRPAQFVSNKAAWVAQSKGGQICKSGFNKSLAFGKTAVMTPVKYVVDNVKDRNPIVWTVPVSLTAGYMAYVAPKVANRMFDTVTTKNNVTTVSVKYPKTKAFVQHGSSVLVGAASFIATAKTCQRFGM